MNEEPPAARAVVYEFHIAGTVGPLARAALPELTAATAPRFTVLTGTVDSRGDLHRLLHALDTHGTRDRPARHPPRPRDRFILRPDRSASRDVNRAAPDTDISRRGHPVHPIRMRPGRTGRRHCEVQAPGRPNQDPPLSGVPFEELNDDAGTNRHHDR